MHSRPKASEEHLDRQLLPSSNFDIESRLAAWVTWCEEHEHELRCYILSKEVGEAETEHILQDILGTLFINVETGRYEVRSEKPLIGYAYGIARRCVSVYYRVLGRHVDLEQAEWRAAGEGLEEYVADAQKREALYAAIAELPPKQGELIRLQLQGYTAIEAARIMGITPEAARKLAFDARKNLRGRLQGLQKEDVE